MSDQQDPHFAPNDSKKVEPAPVALPAGTADPPSRSTASAEYEPVGVVRSFGDYELLDEIGRGGMGVVYRARDRHSGHLIALKMMLSERTQGPNDLKRFSLEA